MHYFLNGGRNEKGVLRQSESLELYKKLGVTRLVVIPYAIMEAEWQRLWHDKTDFFNIPGLETRSLTIYDTDRNFIAETLAWADFVYLTGGAQKTLLRRMDELGTHQALQKVLASGSLRLLGGGSAGAMAIGEQCIVGRDQAESVVNGLNFMPATIIDSHFSNRNRESRLQNVLNGYPQVTGIGLDEDTAAVWNERLTLQTVFGSGTVSVYRKDKKLDYDSSTPITG